MNKKNLSVVMAGAMLATSVAPVLADTTTVQKYEVSENQLGLLKSGLRNTMDSKKYVSTDTGVLEVDDDLNGSADADQSVAGKSVYYITVDATNGSYKAGDKTRNVEVLNGLKAGTKVTVWDNGYREENGKYYSKSNGDSTNTTSTFKLADLEAAYTAMMGSGSAVETKYSKVVKDAVLDKDAGTLEVTFKSVDDSFKNITATYKVGDTKVDFDKVLSKDGVTYYIQSNGDLKSEEGGTGTDLETKNVAGFAPLKEAAGSDIEAKKVAEITIVEDAKNTLLVSDLYDGTMLTDKGYEILAGLKESYQFKAADSQATGIKVYDEDDTSTDATPLTVNATNMATTGVTLKETITDELKANQDTGIVTMEISYTDEYGTKHEYTVRGTNEADAQKLATWLATQDPTVDVLGGATRYETAVAIAKETFTTSFKLGTGGNNDVVLVNGSALVDGLAAAPYAKSLGNDGAPILLSDTDSLPTATKDYLKKLTEDVTPSSMDDITIHLVGGEGVLSDSVKKELKDMGFTVKRVAGDDREETSIAVAKAIKAIDSSVTDAFVVGANGEADAMSVASVSADSTANGTSHVMPIIVSSVHGLSEDAVEYAADYNVTVVGGTTQITNEEYKAVNEANGDKTAKRIAGANRQATNAEVIKEYYSKVSSKPVVIAKDGMNNKSELVDALAASTLASKKGAPIVLGTTKLSDAQINEIELSTPSTMTAVYQVGKGVSEDIVKTLVNKLGL